MLINKVLRSYDVIIVGAGHAGCEAATASARMGASTLLITLKIDNLGEMSCNPAIGGIAKGTIVREIDAMDGIMAKAADMSAIQCKILNSGKGAAVQAPRAQIDRKLYKKAISEIILNHENLDVLIDSVEDIEIKNNKVTGIITNNNQVIKCSSIVLTTGTFLSGLIYIGDKRIKAGRIDEKPSYGLSKTLKKYNFNLGRLKTGTPPRLNRESINFQNLTVQEGDNPPKPFSYMNKKINVEQINCHITYTNPQSHQVILKNKNKSPIFCSKIDALGPRYCPSIEDKIRRFPNNNNHQIFLEPEGLDSNLIYPNGISTSLPEDVQKKFLQKISGLENVEIVRPGYAIEYDFVDPREIMPTLETKKISGLFFAGQINGTTGYEEAGGQGLIAGINAALKINNNEFIIDRSEGYIGVMIDDLTTHGVIEPYRVFTSRSEYRLSIRADNADLRLTKKAIDLGCISKKRKSSFLKKENILNETRNKIQNIKISPNKLNDLGIEIKLDGVKRSIFDLLSFKKINEANIQKLWPEFINIDQEIINLLQTESKYAPYMKRQIQDIEIFKKDEEIKIPKDINYSDIKSLSREAKEKLNQSKPHNIGMASRIAGITPASLMAIIIYLKSRR